MKNQTHLTSSAPGWIRQNPWFFMTIINGFLLFLILFIVMIYGDRLTVSHCLCCWIFLLCGLTSRDSLFVTQFIARSNAEFAIKYLGN